MQITSLTDIIQGELLNSPSISFIYNVKTHAKKVQEGDLFFAVSPDEIETAIAHGAFAIVVDTLPLITDAEIAWIRVDSVKNAIIKYLRYKLSSFELNAYYCDDASFCMLKACYVSNISQKIWLFSTEATFLLNSIHEIKDHDTLICNNPLLLHSLYPKNSEFHMPLLPIENLVEHSLFETSFSYGEHYFSRLKISSLYLQEFLWVYEFLGVFFDLNRLKKTTHFKPIFIDKFFNACEYGKSNKFILIQEKKELALKELDYINKKYKYAKTLVFSKEPLLFNGLSSTVISKIDDILDHLHPIYFNAVYIIGFKQQKVENLFRNNISKTLL